MNNPAAPFGSGPSISEIIDTYGGNKQKIAQAIQMGIVDPTKGLLAGMQIDRVRGAASMEKAPPTTVAQQTFNPQPPAPPPQGIGAPPGAPPQGAPAPQMASAPPQGAPAPHMAGGGIVDLPLPDSMFNERSFAPGGIVAFGSGGDLAEKKKQLYAIINNDAVPSETRRAARVQLNSLYNQGSSSVGLPDLSPITNATYDGPRGMDLVNSLLPNSPQSSSGSIYNPTEGDSASAGNFRESMGHMSDPFPSFSDRVSRDPNASLLRSPQNAGDSIYSPNGNGPDDTTWHGPLHPAKEWLKNTIGLPDSARAVRDNPSLHDPAPKSHWGGLGVDQASEVGDSYLTDRAGNPYSPGMQDAFTPPPPAPRRPHDIMYPKKVPPPSGGVSLLTPDDIATTLSADPNAMYSGTGGLGALAAKQNTPPRTRTGNSPVGGSSGSSSRVSSSSRTPGGSPATSGVPSTGDSFQDYLKMVQGSHPKLEDDPDVKEFADSLKNNKERLAASKKDDMWTALAQIGFGMAGSKSPYFLQAVGEAGSAAMPGIQKAAEARRAEERDDLKSRAELAFKKNGLSRDDAKTAAEMFMKEQDSKRDYQGKIDAANIAALASKYDADSRASSTREAVARSPAIYAANLVDTMFPTMPADQKAKLKQQAVMDVVSGPAATRNDSANRIASLQATDKAHSELMVEGSNYKKLRNSKVPADKLAADNMLRARRDLLLNQGGGKVTGGAQFLGFE